MWLFYLPVRRGLLDFLPGTATTFGRQTQKLEECCPARGGCIVWNIARHSKERYHPPDPNPPHSCVASNMCASPNHAMFDSQATVALKANDLKFKASLAYCSIDAPRTRGRASRRAYDQGHFYMQVPKIGAVFMHTTALS